MRDGQPNPCNVRESAYDASCETSPKLKSKRNTMIALRGQSTWRVFIIHVSSRAFGDAFRKTWMFGNTPLFFSARGGCVYRRADEGS